MTIKMKVDNKTRKVLFENHGMRLIENGIRQAFNEIGKLVRKETQDGIKNPPKTGRRYGKHQASINKSSKEYPANKTGKLRKSINFKVQGKKKLIVGGSAPYGIYLEDGTVNMERRKLLGFTIKKQRNKIKDILRKNINAELKR